MKIVQTSEGQAEGYGVKRNGRIVYSILARECWNNSAHEAHRSASENRYEYGGEVVPICEERSAGR